MCCQGRLQGLSQFLICAIQQYLRHMQSSLRRVGVVISVRTTQKGSLKLFEFHMYQHYSPSLFHISKVHTGCSHRQHHLSILHSLQCKKHRCSCLYSDESDFHRRICIHYKFLISAITLWQMYLVSKFLCHICNLEDGALHCQYWLWNPVYLPFVDWPNYIRLEVGYSMYLASGQEYRIRSKMNCLLLHTCAWWSQYGDK